MKPVIKKISSFGLLLLFLFSLAIMNGCKKRSVPKVIEAIPIPNIESQQKPPVIAIYRYSGRRSKEVSIIHLIWDDGTVVFSENSVRGGPPYFKVKTLESTINTFFARLAEKDISWEDHTYPDGGFTAIAIIIEGKKKTMLSCHELAEESGVHVWTDHGSETLGNRSIEEVLGKQSSRYQKFRSDWAFLRKELQTLIPSKGEPFKNESFELVYE